ncbi:MAG: transketolase family protein [Candidatus Aenigmarchaeota archaeon]|nr:transketolase family protein [Candidatus Aenigmarchaeota archaeon]
MYLSEKLYGDVDQVPTRNGYGHGLVELGETNKDVVVLTADISDSVRTQWFADKYPDRFIEVGISEQDMMGIAAGLATVGKIPFVSTYGVFCTGRAWDQIRTTVAYGDFNVKIGGAHGGISVGADGATHQALEEITLTRVLPNMTVIVPADSEETKKATLAAAATDGPFMLRFGREKVPVVTTEKTPFKVGRAETYVFGDDISIIACGPMVYEAIIAAKELDKKGISVRVINMHTVKPIDKETIIKAAKETGAIVTAEEHQVAGGMGSAVAEVVVENCPVPIKLVGVRDRFGESGEPEELMVEFNLKSTDIIKAAEQVLEMKK